MSATMADLNTFPGLTASATTPATADTGSRHHQRSKSKSSVLRSLMGGGHRRNNSDGSGLPSAPLYNPIATTQAFHASHRDLVIGNNHVVHVGFDPSAAAAMEPQRYAHALGELQQNRQERSPERPRGRDRGDRGGDQQPPPSPIKAGFATFSLKLGGGGNKDRDSSKLPKTRDNTSPAKPKKAKSATNLAALLRPRSIKSLKQLLMDEDTAARAAAAKEKEKDKENRSPPNSLGSDHHAPPPPIYAQFATQNFGPPSPQVESPGFDTPSSSRSGSGTHAATAAPSLGKKPRPKSFQPQMIARRQQEETARSTSTESAPLPQQGGSKRLTWGRGGNAAPPPGIAPRPEMGSRAKSAELPFIDPKDIDKHLEAMLDRRNIPENQRYKMRNLSDTIKMEFIRQDWAEMQAKLEISSADGGAAAGVAGGAVGGGEVIVAGTGASTGTAGQDEAGTEKKKKKHGRGLSLTIVRGSNKSNPSSPVKKQKGDSSLGRHFRTKSSESLVSEPPSSAGLVSGYGSNFLAKVKGQQLPGDFVAYLQKVQRPELVEVGKLHKLRLLLRNETVAWTEEFIRQGGMKEIVELLHRIMAVEWRYVLLLPDRGSGGGLWPY